MGNYFTAGFAAAVVAICLQVTGMYDMATVNRDKRKNYLSKTGISGQKQNFPEPSGNMAECSQNAFNMGTTLWFGLFEKFSKRFSKNGLFSHQGGRWSATNYDYRGGGGPLTANFAKHTKAFNRF